MTSLCAHIAKPLCQGFQRIIYFIRRRMVADYRLKTQLTGGSGGHVMNESNCDSTANILLHIRITRQLWTRLLFFKSSPTTIHLTALCKACCIYHMLVCIAISNTHFISRSRILLLSFLLYDVLCGPTDLTWRLGNPFEAIIGRTTFIRRSPS